MRIPMKWPMGEFSIVFRLSIAPIHTEREESITSTRMRHTFQRICTQCDVHAYKFHLILSIRFFIGLNEQFTENLVDIFEWMRPAWHTMQMHRHMLWASHTRTKKSSTRMAQVYVIGSVKTKWNFFVWWTKKELNLKSHWICPFGCLFLKTIVFGDAPYFAFYVYVE